MTARSGGLPPETRTGSWASKSLEPSYEMVMPVQVLNSAQDFCSESDSGLMIEANIVTFVPACPAYAWYLEQEPVSVGAALALLLVPEVFEQATSVARASAGATRTSLR